MDGFRVVTGGQWQTVAAGDSVVLTGLPTGSNDIAIVDLATHCSFLGPGNRRVEVNSGLTTRVEFRTVCFGEIAYVSTRDNRRDVHYMDAFGNHINLSDSPQEDIISDVSPDGTRVLFVRDPFGTPDIYVVNVDRTNLTNLTDTPATAESGPRWSPDGATIVFASDRDSDGDVFTMNPDGTNVFNVTQSLVNEGEPDWSADGQRLVFGSTGATGDREVFVIDADGTNRTNVSNHSASDRRPNWSPGGDLIVFESSRGGQQEPWVVGPDGSGLRRLAQQVGLSYEWSPNGARLLFDSFGANFDIMIVNADGSGLMNLTDDPANEGGGKTWLPDGSWIILSVVRDGHHLFAIRPDGTLIRQFTWTAASELYPQTRVD